MSQNPSPVNPITGSFPPGFSSPNYRPPHSQRPSSPETMTQYTIQQGDTLWALSTQFHSTIQAIIDANPGIDPNNLTIGAIISIPGPQAEARNYILVSKSDRYALCPRAYFVKPEETLYSISYKSRIPMNEIIAANPGVHFGLPLTVGQYICLPFIR